MWLKAMLRGWKGSTMPLLFSLRSSARCDCLALRARPLEAHLVPQHVRCAHLQQHHTVVKGLGLSRACHDVPWTTEF